MEGERCCLRRAARLISADAARHDPHRRFRLPGHPADRPPGARGGGLLGDRAVPVRGRGASARTQAEGRDPVRRAGIGRGRGVAARPAGDLRAPACRCSASATASRRWPRSSAARSRAGTMRSSAAPRSRSSPTARSSDGIWHVGRALPGLDEPRRPGHQAARRLRDHRGVRERALRARRRRGAPALRRPVPPGGRAHAARRAPPAQLRARHRRRRGRLVDGRLPGRRRSSASAPGRATAG